MTPPRVLLIDSLSSEHAMLRRVALNLLHTLLRAVGAHVLVCLVLPFIVPSQDDDRAQESTRDGYHRPLHQSDDSNEVRRGGDTQSELSYGIEDAFPAHFIDLLTTAHVHSPDDGSFVEYLDGAAAAIHRAETSPWYRTSPDHTPTHSHTQQPHTHTPAHQRNTPHTAGAAPPRDITTRPSDDEDSVMGGTDTPHAQLHAGKHKRLWADRVNLLRALLSRFTHFYTLPVAETVLLTTLMTAMSAFGGRFEELRRYLLDPSANSVTAFGLIEGEEDNPFNTELDSGSTCLYDTLRSVALEGKTFIEAGIDDYEHSAEVLRSAMGRRANAGVRRTASTNMLRGTSGASANKPARSSTKNKTDDYGPSAGCDTGGTDRNIPSGTGMPRSRGGLSGALKRMVSTGVGRRNTGSVAYTEEEHEEVGTDTHVHTGWGTQMSAGNEGVEMPPGLVRRQESANHLQLSSQEKIAIQNMTILEEFLKGLTAYSIEQYALR
ncbi:hypothetical protein SARC_11311 [Sphaeroforma arctica JP610]|uniref:Uncharacterized protein n=1 Tax=Sphaeroforma arctica JP610 TaxID=667725 RepID=A0A0L0FHC7_9EUKA|nr:hypothetical protein SARC_11311 [Sphaeroforma arctica JP610]KNC76177.1 hypothetical protein SARC_11311 [Sphaeroforma arctica JP610]|eukprot:XP_014150079.1 hypothetical protein SARC_11311 [Sphaeroforma arctica JP610]